MKNIQVHPSAIIDSGAVIGDGTFVWHWSHICGSVKIGKNCTFGQNTFIGERVVIGNNCKIQNNVSVYESVILEDDVFCGPSMVFTNVYNPRSSIDRKNEYQQTLVKKGVTIGANATIVCGVTLNKYCFVGAGSVVTQDVKSYALVVGVPAKQVGWISEFGKKLALPLTGNAEIACEHTGQKYQLSNGKLVKIS
jgi:UDP-2-acetamido-3-amino-2,3-dideoxy-glucuronate N-acetyltransferase